LAPIIPFVTDVLWRQLYGEKSIHREIFPEVAWSTGASEYTEKLLEFNSKVWYEKKSKGLSLKASIEVDMPKDLQGFSRDLKAMHNIEA
jgi:valyl-tRNA synthetase